MTRQLPSLAVAWSQLPPYGAAVLQKARERLPQPFPILRTAPRVPYREVEAMLGTDPITIPEQEPCSWSALRLSVPEVFVYSGWSRRAFQTLAAEVKAAGGVTISMIDTAWMGTLRQYLGAVAFRVSMGRQHDFLWVPGEAGVQAARWFGYSSGRILRGVYAASPEVFTPGPLLADRPKRFLYVGRFAPEKGLDCLMRAFADWHRTHPEWELHCTGTGELRGLLEACEGVQLHEFGSAREVAQAMQQARFLILPSLFEPFGVVVHEATLCGCGILASERVGAARDLVKDDQNGKIFRSRCVRSCREALEWAASRGPDELSRMQGVSTELAQQFSPDKWAETLENVLIRIRNRNF